MLVLLMRHGESVANLTHEDCFDPSLTELGASQASAWRECARTWDLDAVLVSPLLRCVQTAAHALGGASRARWMIVPEAREHWWDLEQCRGRLKTDLEPLIEQLPFNDKLSLDRIAQPSEHWDPAAEATASKRELNRRCKRASLASRQQRLFTFHQPPNAS